MLITPKIFTIYITYITMLIRERNRNAYIYKLIILIVYDKME